MRTSFASGPGRTCGACASADTTFAWSFPVRMQALAAIVTAELMLAREPPLLAVQASILLALAWVMAILMAAKKGRLLHVSRIYHHCALWVVLPSLTQHTRWQLLSLSCAPLSWLCSCWQREQHQVISRCHSDASTFLPGLQKKHKNKDVCLHLWTWVGQFFDEKERKKYIDGGSRCGLLEVTISRCASPVRTKRKCKIGNVIPSWGERRLWNL